MKISGVPTEEQSQVNNIYTVDADGMVNMPYINKVRATGRTPGQLASEIESSYRSSKIFTNPAITIMMQPQAFRECRRGSGAPPRESRLLLTGINASGGFNDFADQKRVRLLRRSEAKLFDVRQFWRDPSLDPRLQPGDRVEVPQSFF